jgi:aspartyl-tRNA(Asn)/glutamyl-tRNA(Gln) amidotransferase subunit C
VSLGADEVSRIATLARLAIAPADQARLARELDAILDLVRRLADAATADVAPLAHPLETTAPLRADAVTEPDRHAVLLPLAPQAHEGLYRVPRVIE